MRVLAIGDIHGCLRAFDLLLDMVQPQPDDLLVTLGDYVDRGPDSKGVLDRLIELQNRCRHVAIRGNHDLMMLHAREGSFLTWYASGAKQTLQSYGAGTESDSFAEIIPAAHWSFLERTCLPFHEIDTHFFVHANVHHDVPLANQPDDMLYWDKLDPLDSRPHVSNKIMICGHSAQRSGKPLVLKHAVCIDTWVYGDGWLTCLDVKTGQYWQADQKGKRDMRTGWLDDEIPK